MLLCRRGVGAMQQTLSDRVRWLVEDVARNIVGLDLMLFFQAHPGVFDTVTGIAGRVARPAEQIGEALDRLADAAILEVHELGAGRYKCYSLNRTEEVWHLLCRLSELYLDNPNARRHIIQMLIRRHDDKDKAKPSEEGAHEKEEA